MLTFFALASVYHSCCQQKNVGFSEAWKIIVHKSLHCDIQVYFTAEQLRASARADPNIGHLVQREHPQNQGGIGVGSLRSTKTLQYLQNGARQDQCYYDGLIGSCIRAFDWYQNQRPWITLNGVSRGAESFKVHAIISGTGKATDFKFGRYIHRVHPNKSSLKILDKRERGHIQRLPEVFKYLVLSQEWVKLRTSNFIRTFLRSITTKAH